MKTRIVEARSGAGNWGKFLIGVFDEHETTVRSAVATEADLADDLPASDAPVRPLPPLLDLIGWDHRVIWVLDLQTREGAAFRPGGYHLADLEEHRIWVCPLFEPFLGWLYTAWRGSLDELPRVVQLDGVPLQLSGYRRRGPVDEPC